METHDIEAKENIPASRKLQASDARDLLASASKLIAMKGKKTQEFSVAKSVPEEAVQAMLGPTGNLRSPTLVRGKTILVGYNEEVFEKTLG